MTLMVELNDEQTQQLEKTARRLNMTINDLARAAIQDLLARQDADFERALHRVLDKNAELYRRLA